MVDQASVQYRSTVNAWRGQYDELFSALWLTLPLGKSLRTLTNFMMGLNERTSYDSPCTSPITSDQLLYRLQGGDTCVLGSVNGKSSIPTSISQWLCSNQSSQYLLNAPAVKTQIARRAFSHATPSVSNNACWHLTIWVIRPFSNSNMYTLFSASFHKLITWLPPLPRLDRLLFHGVMFAALPETLQLLTLWPPLTWAYHLLVQPQ